MKYGKKKKENTSHSPGNPKTGLSKCERIPKGYKPRGQGQGQRPTEK